MISKHIDLIAIGFLLFGLAVFSGARHAVVMTMSGPVHYYRLDDGRQVRVPAMPRMPIMPKVPELPEIPLQRD